ncbi:hypothetical protein MKX07_005038, partial [Trichoderma sp. CBMAI-0711]
IPNRCRGILEDLAVMAANTEPGFFRLIVLSQGQWDDEIRCTLLPFNRSRDGYPPYRALSYVWGRWCRTPPEVLVNGRKVRVTPNLENALRHLRHEEEEITLWIDALCIDQSNTEERSSQVAQMENPNQLGALEDIPDAHMAALAEALRHTLLAPWWDRIWVVQEAVVANSLIVAEVHMAPVLVAIRNTKSLAVLNGDHSRKIRPDIPSWVPDWSTEPAKVLGEWTKVARGRPVEYAHDTFLRTIFSDMKKTPDGSLRRLQAGNIDSRDGGLILGRDPDETLAPLFLDYDRFAEVIRLSISKRAMFFINDVDEFYSASLKSLEKQEMLLSESEKLFGQNGKEEAHIETLHQHMKLISEARLLQHSRFLRPREDNLMSEFASLDELFDGAMRFLNGRLVHYTQGLSIRENAGEEYAPEVAEDGEAPQPEILDREDFRKSQEEMINGHRKLLRQQKELILQNKRVFDKDNDEKQLKSQDLYYDRRFFAKYGHMGMGPMLMKEGDEVYILPGSRVPLVLRLESCCLHGFDILTIDELSDDKHSWKDFNDGCVFEEL